MTAEAARVAVLRHVGMVPGCTPEFLDEWLGLPAGTAARVLELEGAGLAARRARP